MSNMKGLPGYIKQWKTKGVEIQKRGDRYYAYRISSRWDAVKKRAQKVTLGYLGVVTSRGIVKVRDCPKRYSVFEFGNVELIRRLSRDVESLIRTYFPDVWKEIFSMAVLITLYQSNLRTARPFFEKSYLHRYYPVSRLSPKSLSKMYYDLGLRERERLVFMRDLFAGSEYLAVDMTFIFSESKNIEWLEFGYNSKHEYHKQLSILLAFSLDKKEPVYIRVLPGSVRDVSTIKRLLMEIPDGVMLVIVTDKGFYSEGNVDLLDEYKIYYVIPLRRDLEIIHYPGSYDRFFKYRDRNIMYHSYPFDDKRKIIVFFDPKLQAEEENTYLDLIRLGKKDMQGFNKSKERFGTIAILVKADKKDDEVYSFYKQRCDVEEVFDVLKNVLNADRSYLRTDEHIRGYMFVMLISLILHYRLLNVLRKADLINVVSVKEVLVHLSKIYVVEDGFGDDILSEVPKKARELLEKMGIELLLNSGHQ